MSQKIIESYRKKLAAEEGWSIKHGAQLRIALCYPNTHNIGMANLGLHTMYELFNRIPEVSCERVFLPDDAEMREYEKSNTPLLSLETQTPVRDFDVIAFSISFETDYLNMAKMLQMSRVPVWAKDRNHFHPLVVMGGAASFLNPEPIAEFTDIIAVGEGEILAYQLVDTIFEKETKEEILLALAKIGRGFYIPSLYEVIYNEDGTVFDYLPTAEGVPSRVGRALAHANPKEGTLRRAMRRGETEIVDRLLEQDVFALRPRSGRRAPRWATVCWWKFRAAVRRAAVSAGRVITITRRASSPPKTFWQRPPSGAEKQIRSGWFRPPSATTRKFPPFLANCEKWITASRFLR